MSEFTIKGLDAVLAKLKGLSPKLQKKGLRTAARKGATVIKNAVVQNAKMIDDPATAESIAKNVAVQFSSRLSKREGGIAYRVGILGGARQYANTKLNRRKSRVGAGYKTAGDKTNPGGDTWYWRFVEFGTSRMAARPFLQPAMAQSAERATDVFVEALNKEIDKALK